MMLMLPSFPAAPFWLQVGLVFHDVIAATEAVNCQELQLQVRVRLAACCC